MLQRDFAVFMLFMLFMAIIALPAIIAPMFEDRKVRGGVYNMDSGARSFCYVTDMDRQYIIERLSIHSGYDKLDYEFDATNCIITFNYCGSRTEYQLYFLEKRDYTYVEVYQMHFLSNIKGIFYKINPFFVTKLDVRPIEYSEYLKIKKEAEELNK